MLLLSSEVGNKEVAWLTGADGDDDEGVLLELVLSGEFETWKLLLLLVWLVLLLLLTIALVANGKDRPLVESERRGPLGPAGDEASFDFELDACAAAE